MKFSEVDRSKIDKLLVAIFFVVTYGFGLMAGLWWLDDDLARGFIYLIMLYIVAYEIGYKKMHRSRSFFLFSSIAPCILGTIFFLFGFWLKK